MNLESKLIQLMERVESKTYKLNNNQNALVLALENLTPGLVERAGKDWDVFYAIYYPLVALESFPQKVKRWFRHTFLHKGFPPVSYTRVKEKLSPQELK